MEPTRELIDEIFRDRVQRARAMDPAEKLLAGPRLFDRACRIMADGIRAQFLGVSEEEVQRILDERLAIVRRVENKR